MAILTTLLILGVLIVFYYIFAKWKQQFWKRNGVPQLKPNILFGDTLLLTSGKTSVKDFYKDIYFNNKAKGQKFVGIYHALLPEIVITDAALCKRIMKQDFEYFTSHGLFHHKTNILTMHLFNLEGEEWKLRRTKLTPMFTSSKMKMMFDAFVIKSEQLFSVVNKCGINEAINAKDFLRRFTTDIIAYTAFGLDLDTLNKPQHEFREIGEESFKPRLLNFALEKIFSRNFLGNIGYQALPSRMVQYYSKVIKETLNYRETSGIERKDFIQLMLQLKHHGKIDDGMNENQKIQHFLSDKEIIAETFLMYLAGFETSSSTMTFALYELAMNQEIQNKLRGEVKEVIAKHGGLTYEAVIEMEYLDRVVKETLRKYPILTVIPRECTRDYKIPNTNAFIRKGTSVQIPCIALQMDPEFYPNPEIFDPERFSNKNKLNDAPWIPFGDGPRQCIGMRFGTLQTKMGIITLIKNFRIFLDKSMNPPLQTCKALILYSFEEDLKLKIEKV
ncbi:hypothetical protein ABEB36_004400 [Hypothenemus hampei]|uniref:Cytochrome P450 n=1 Tax=Hypothenemus hampei TaxID=57062 RepID=A0ABD1F385_HYPHA